MASKAPERKYALRRVKAGDYIFFSNDQQTLLRVARYEDGPSHGIKDWPKDRMFWGVWKWETPIVLGQTAIELANWDRWQFFDGFNDTRQEAIDSALRCTQPTQQKEAQ